MSNPVPGGRDFVRFEKEGWDGIAHAYHRFLGPVTALAAPALLDAAREGPGYAAGLALSRGAAVTAVEFTQRLTGKEALWEGVMSGTVRISALVRGRDRATRERIRVELDRLLEPFTGTGSALDLPVSVLVGSARR